MDLDLPADVRARLTARVDDGLYPSEAEVLRDALDALDRAEEEKLTRWRERNQLAEEQSRQGLSQPLDDERVLGRLRDRLRAEGVLD